MSNDGVATSRWAWVVGLAVALAIHVAMFVGIQTQTAGVTEPPAGTTVSVAGSLAGVLGNPVEVEADGNNPSDDVEPETEFEIVEVLPPPAEALPVEESSPEPVQATEVETVEVRQDVEDWPATEVQVVELDSKPLSQPEVAAAQAVSAIQAVDVATAIPTAVARESTDVVVLSTPSSEIDPSENVDSVEVTPVGEVDPGVELPARNRSERRQRAAARETREAEQRRQRDRAERQQHAAREREREAERAEQQRRSERRQRAERQRRTEQRRQSRQTQRARNQRAQSSGRASRRGTSQSGQAGARRGGSGRSSASRGQINAYASRVRARILSRRPSARGQRGRVVISFRLSTSGGLRSARISRSSGNRALDRAALAAVRRAAPFPRPPNGARSGQLSFSIPFTFR